MLAYEKLLADPKKTLVQVEPNLSITASKANTWIPLTPGTEAALALSMACVIIQEKLYDQAVEETTSLGLKMGRIRRVKLSPALNPWLPANMSPKKLLKLQVFPRKRLSSWRKNLPAAKSPVAVAGKGKGIMPGDTSEYMAIMSLNALVGSINRKGGCGPVFRPPVAPLPRSIQGRYCRGGIEIRTGGRRIVAGICPGD